MNTNIISIEGFGTWARLGNQMFQYAYLRVLECKYNFTIKLPRLRSPFGYPQAQIFDAFDLNIGLLPENTKFSLVKKETTMMFDKNVLVQPKDINQNILFEGYFQSPKYFEGYFDVIRKDFTFKKSIREKGDTFIKTIKKSCKFTIALHVRRTDNISKDSPTVIVSELFRKNAINYMKKRIENYKILVFSDDKKWCKQNLDYPNILIVEGFSDLEDMYIMSLCDHFIIGSSTFSWWSAWLSTNKEKIIIIPDKWCGDRIMYGKKLSDQESDLLPDKWVRLSN
jgi:hypothetical protein